MNPMPSGKTERRFTTKFPPTASTRGGMKRAPAAASTPVSPRRKPGPIDTGLWNMIGVGRGDWFRSPSRRTGRAGLPHPALRSMVLPATGLTGLGMGVTQAVKPLLGKVGIGPPDVVAAAREARAAVAFAQDVPQASAYPSVERRKRRAMAVLEVLEPAPQRAVEIPDDGGQTVPRR